LFITAFNSLRILGRFFTNVFDLGVDSIAYGSEYSIAAFCTWYRMFGKPATVGIMKKVISRIYSGVPIGK
jgi:hypothetical protein